MIHEIDFALTTYCQAKCRTCARTNRETGETADWLELKHMDFEVYKSVLENNKAFADMSKTRLNFCGEFGDPMMHPEIEKFIEYTSNTGLEWLVVNTNGGLRKPEWYHKMADFQNVRIEWGIDGTDHDTNWKYREGVNWQRAMDNMTAWFANDGCGHWAFLLFEWNWHQIPEAIKMAEDIGTRIEFKLNRRDYGLLTPENRTRAVNLLKEHGFEV